jgi:hypothetical protein
MGKSPGEREGGGPPSSNVRETIELRVALFTFSPGGRQVNLFLIATVLLMAECLEKSLHLWSRQKKVHVFVSLSFALSYSISIPRSVCYSCSCNISRSCFEKNRESIFANNMFDAK